MWSWLVPVINVSILHILLEWKIIKIFIYLKVGSRYLSSAVSLSKCPPKLGWAWPKVKSQELHRILPPVRQGQVLEPSSASSQGLHWQKIESEAVAGSPTRHSKMV